MLLALALAEDPAVQAFQVSDLVPVTVLLYFRWNFSNHVSFILDANIFTHAYWIDSVSHNRGRVRNEATMDRLADYTETQANDDKGEWNSILWQ